MPCHAFPLQSSVTRLILCVAIGSAATAVAQTAKSDLTEVAALRVELQRLSRDLLQYRAELIEWKMQALSAELRLVEAERHRLGTERQVMEREIGELNLASTNNPGGEDEGRREELTNLQVPALLAGETAAAARATTLASALHAENVRLSEIRQQLQRSGSAPQPKSP